MSYIFNNSVKYSDSMNLDAFGRLRTSNVTSLLEYKHIFDKSELVIDEVTAGTVTSLYNAVNSEIVMTTSANNSYVIRQGKSFGIYQPGKGQLVEASFSNFQIETNVIKRVGYYTSTQVAPYNSVFDGFFLESNGVTNNISFQIWKSGTSIVSAVTSTWLTTDYDVINMDWSKTQLLFVDFQWLGVGRLRFGLVIDGTVKTFFANSATNNQSTVYMKSPNQPIRYEIRQLGAGSGSFDMICSQISLEGSVNTLQRSLGLVQFNTINAATAGVKYPLIGYRLRNGYEGVNITLSDIQTINTTSPSKSDFYVTIELNPTFSSNAIYSSVTNSAIAYSIGTGQTVTSNGYVIASFLGSGDSPQVDAFEFKDNSIRPGINIDGTYDVVWICVVAELNNQTLRTSINLSYFL